MGTDVLPSFTSPPPAAARGARIGSHRSDQAEASRSPATDAQRLLETRPEGLQELEPLSSTECKSKTHRHRHTHTQTHRHMEGHTYVCTYMCVRAPLPYGHTHGWSQAPLPTNHCQSKWSVLTSPTHQDGPPPHHCSDVGETWAALLALSLLAWCLPQRVYLFRTSVEIIVIITRTLVLERGRVASQAGSGCSVKAH